MKKVDKFFSFLAIRYEKADLIKVFLVVFNRSKRNKEKKLDIYQCFLMLNFYESSFDFQTPTRLPQRSPSPEWWIGPEKPEGDKELTVEEMKKSKKSLETLLFQRKLKLVPVRTLLVRLQTFILTSIFFLDCGERQ